MSIVPPEQLWQFDLRFAGSKSIVIKPHAVGQRQPPARRHVGMRRAGEHDFDRVNHATPFCYEAKKQHETTLDRHSHRKRSWNQCFHLARMCDKISQVTRRSRLFLKGSAGGDSFSIADYFEPALPMRCTEYCDLNQANTSGKSKRQRLNPSLQCG